MPPQWFENFKNAAIWCRSGLQIDLLIYYPTNTEFVGLRNKMEAIVYCCYLEFKLCCLKNLNVLIRVNELFEPLGLRKKATCCCSF